MYEGIVVHDKLFQICTKNQGGSHLDIMMYSLFLNFQHIVLVLGWLTHAFHDIQQGKCITYELRILFACEVHVYVGAG